MRCAHGRQGGNLLLEWSTREHWNAKCRGGPFRKGKVVVLHLTVWVFSCGKAVAYLSSSLITVSWSQGVVMLLLPLQNQLFYSIMLLIVEGVHFKEVWCGEWLEGKEKYRKICCVWCFFIGKKFMTRILNSVAPSVIFRVSRVSKVVNHKHMAVGSHPSDSLKKIKLPKLKIHALVLT